MIHVLAEVDNFVKLWNDGIRLVSKWVISTEYISNFSKTNYIQLIIINECSEEL
jgi:hypothetical protein